MKEIARNAATTKQELSPVRQQLLAQMQQLNFGRIEQLVIRGGEPVLDPEPVIVREHKFAGENGPRSEQALRDYQLKRRNPSAC